MRPLRYQGVLQYGRIARESTMSIDTSDGHKAMDYREHVRTYDGFLKGSIVLVVLVALILISMLVFLV